MRTLIISDLHLGNRAHRDVLRFGAPRARLLEALGAIDRLVLLGDTVELMTRHPRRSMAIAEPVLREIGQRLGSEREVILVPGNHDAPMVRAWARDRGSRLEPSDVVNPAASPALAHVTSWLAPARVSVRYPGVWLDHRVWATHGHYLDRHLLPESAFGLPRGRLQRGAGSPARPIDYERARRRRAGKRSREGLPARLAARPVATLVEAAAELLRRATMPQVPILMMNARLAPLTAKLTDAQMRHASLRAMAYVTQRLGVQAEWVVFGHVHRAGPLNGERWPGGAGEARLLNTGSWLYEPLLIDRASPPHPYWPGGAVLLESGHEPRALGLLDALGPQQLHPR
ncbi:MAG: metallophosphoesterase [Solirubrobacteraceae bacterium]